MKGDFTRFSHQPDRRYAGVLMQQGRVTLDADWNEQFDIEDHRWRVQTIDTIGRACAPVHDAGFGISFTPDGTDLIIGPGRIYVDGLLVENDHGTWVDVDDVVDDDNDQGRVVLSDMTPDGRAFEFGQWIEVAWDDAEFGSGSAVGTVTDVAVDSIAINLFDGPDTVPANLQLRRLVTYLTQPFFPAAADPPFGDVFTPEAWEAQRHLVYLDVWRRHVTAIEDPTIRETALGGPDTATRVQTAWAVRILFDDPLEGLPFDAAQIGCHDPLDLWDDLTAPKLGRMSAQAEAVEDPEDPCAIKPEAGYRGLENRLYRVEIHDPGDPGTATFKWSRDNGSILSSIVGFPDNDEVEVHSLGKDQVLRFHADDRVEVLSDESELSGLAGTVATIDGQPDEAERIITLDTDVSLYQTHHTPRLRRWDQPAAPMPTAGTWIDLEDGVQVRFEDGPFEIGDYWTIPARVTTGDVEGFIDAPPRGIHHHFARLALVTWSQDVGDVDAPLTFSVTDCRRTFPPLCEIPTGGGEGCATVTVGDGVTSVGEFTSIQAAVDAVAPEGPAHIAILPGTYVLGGTVEVRHARLTISGCDDQTRIVSPQGPAFRLVACAEVRLERLRIEAASPAGAVVVDSSREIVIDRCTILNGTTADREGVDDLTAVVTRTGSTLGTRLNPSGPALRVDGSVFVWILANRLLGSPALSLQARAVTVRDNTMRYGGVWLRDGSGAAIVSDNDMLGGSGHGVGLGGLAAGEKPATRSTGVRYVEITNNRISSMSQSGVGTVSGPPPPSADEDRPPVVVAVPRFEAADSAELVASVAGQVADARSVAYVRPQMAGIEDLRLRTVAALGDVSEIDIHSNTIVGCALDDPDPFFDPEAVGGVVLGDVAAVRITDNDISDNGGTSRAGRSVARFSTAAAIGSASRRAVGIFLNGCRAAEVSDNRVVGNGSDGGAHVDFTPGGSLEGPNPLVVGGFTFEHEDANITQVMPLFGFLVTSGVSIALPAPARHVDLTVFSIAGASVIGIDEAGNAVATAELSEGLQTVALTGAGPFATVQVRPEAVSDDRANLTILSICAGESCRWYQGGIIGVDLSAPDTGPAVRVHDNVVVAPAGQALLLEGVGQMSIADNSLTSLGTTLQSSALDLGTAFPVVLLPRTVFIFNAGRSLLVGNQGFTTGVAGGRRTIRVAGGTAEKVSLGGNVVFARTTPEESAAVGAVAADPRDRSIDGRVLVHGNHVTFRPPVAQGFILASVGVASADDVGILDNQVMADTAGRLLLVDVMSLGVMLRVADNTFTEPVGGAVLSGLLFGWLAHVTGNQATNCISVTGVVDEVVDNQIVIEQVVDQSCERLTKTIGVAPSAFLGDVLGGGG